ncbi:MAG: AbrB/MazE/SpoVT family DNA-binding domain-containing protein [Minisyncoccia bacterium]
MVHNRTISVRKWGNGHGVLLPKAFVDSLGLESAEVETTLRGSSIILTKAIPVKSKKLTLAAMVKGIRKNDRHELIDFGKPRGREVW